MTKPNLLLIMCDQLRADALGCYGNPLVQTPNIDRLAQLGVCFDRAYSQTPVCVPARYGLMAGKNAFQLGLIDNAPMKEDISHPLPEMIRSEGYSTSAVGKMHFNPVRKHYGFDRMHLSEEVPGHREDDDFLQFLKEKGYGHVTEPHGKRSEHYYVPQKSELPEEVHTTAWTAERTCDIIRKNRNRPFFIFSSFIKPHPPFDPVEPYDEMYSPEDIPEPVRGQHERESSDLSIHIQNDYKVNGIDHVSDEDTRRIRASYYACVTQIDTQIGHILDTLEEYQLLDNTLIVFTSDHGEMLGDHYGFGKRTFYESSARIPFIVSGKGVPQGERNSQLVALQDAYATFIKASGGRIPEDSTSMDVLDMIQHPHKQYRKQLHAEFGTGRQMKFMLRWGDFKYVYHTNGGLENLFDLGLDPDELNDIADEHPEMCKQCQAEMVRYYQSHHFDEALEGNQLKRYEYQAHERRGYLNQYPSWPEKVVD